MNGLERYALLAKTEKGTKVVVARGPKDCAASLDDEGVKRAGLAKE